MVNACSTPNGSNGHLKTDADREKAGPTTKHIAKPTIEHPTPTQTPFKAEFFNEIGILLENSPASSNF